MSAKTRIKRPTTSTPRKVGTERMIHESKTVEVLGKDVTGKPIVRMGKGSTYRKAQG
jgi:hypothetical protein